MNNIFEEGTRMMKDAIETAIKMETDAMAFYREAADKTTHPFGKEMFKGFIKDETRHLKILQDVFRGNDVNAELVRPRESIKTVFSELKDAMMQRVKALDTEMEAVNIALKFEKKVSTFIRSLPLPQNRRRKKSCLKNCPLRKMTTIPYSWRHPNFSKIPATGICMKREESWKVSF